MKSLGFFITGTDTGCGKTYVTSGLMRAYARAGLRVAGMKPIASGAIREGERLVNADVEAIMAAANVEVGRGHVNNYLFEPPASPHIAVAESAGHIELEPIRKSLSVCRAAADMVIVEGVGGWCVPLSRDLWLVDMVRALDLPVVLTVGIKLGCINHALLTMREMERAGVRSLAWIANVVESELYALPAVVATVSEHLTIPLLGTLPYMAATQPPASDHVFDQIAARLVSLFEQENQ